MPARLLSLLALRLPPLPSPRHRVPDIFSDQAFIFLKVKTEQKKKYKETAFAAYVEARVVGLKVTPPSVGKGLGTKPNVTSALQSPPKSLPSPEGASQILPPLLTPLSYSRLPAVTLAL